MLRLTSIIAIGSLLLSSAIAAERDICAGGPSGTISDWPSITMEAIPKSLTIGYRADANPFSFVDEDGTETGYVVDLCREIVLSLQRQGRVENVIWKVLDSSERWSALNEARIDLLCDSSTLTLARQARFAASLMVFPSGPGTAVNRSRVSRAGLLGVEESDRSLRVGILGGASTIQQYCDHEEDLIGALGTETLVPELIESYAEGAERLQNLGPNYIDPVDVVFADREILAATFRDNQEIQVSGTYFGYEPYSIFARKGALDLIHSVNVELVNIFSSRTIHELLNQYFPSGVRESVGQLIILQRLPRGDLPAVDADG